MGHSKHLFGIHPPILQPWHGPGNTQLITGPISFTLSLPSAFSSSYGHIMIINTSCILAQLEESHVITNPLCVQVDVARSDPVQFLSGDITVRWSIWLLRIS